MTECFSVGPKYGGMKYPRMLIENSDFYTELIE